MRHLRQSSPLRALVVGLLLGVLALRVAIPSGYMLDPQARGWPRLVACPAAAPIPPPTPPIQMAAIQMAAIHTAKMHMATMQGATMQGATMQGATMQGAAHAADHGHHQHDHKTSDHPCAFAAASAAVDLAAMPPVAILPHPRAGAAVALHLFARPGLGLAAPPPPKTGPPAFA